MGAAWTRVRNETVRVCPARHDMTGTHDLPTQRLAQIQARSMRGVT